MSLFGAGAIVLLASRAFFFLGNSTLRQFAEVGSRAYIVIIMTVAFDLLAVPLALWWLVGAWRSASKPSQRSAASYAKLSVKIAICGLALGLSSALLLILPSVVLDQISLLRDDVGAGPRGVRVRPDGRMIEIYGFLSGSVATSFTSAVEANPSVAIIELRSFGGRDFAAHQIRNVIASRGLDTLVSSECNSACTIAFLGGKHRLMGQTARLGFHAGRSGLMPTEAQDETVRQEELAQGISKDFLQRAFSTPARSIWYPSSGELKAAGVVTTILPPSPAEP